MDLCIIYIYIGCGREAELGVWFISTVDGTAYLMLSTIFRTVSGAESCSTVDGTGCLPLSTFTKGRSTVDGAVYLPLSSVFASCRTKGRSAVDGTVFLPLSSVFASIRTEDDAQGHVELN